VKRKVKNASSEESNGRDPAIRNSEVLNSDQVSPFPDMFLLAAQAACKIAGRNINVAVIQSMVLGCNTHCPGQVRAKHA